MGDTATAVKFIDIAGLAPSAPPPEYIDALGLKDAVPIAAEHRLLVLKRLARSAGVHVYTGPRGAPFWQAVSVEVSIHVVPDDYDPRDRLTPGMAWALGAVGVPPLLAGRLAARYARREPTKALGLYGAWQAAKTLLAEYNAVDVHPPIIVNATAVEVVTDPAEQLALIDRLDDVAFDWEWNIDPALPLNEPEGLSAATADRTWYLPIVASDYTTQPGHSEAVRARVADAVARRRTTFHNAKADLGTQHPGDPLEVFGAKLDDTLVMGFVAGEYELGLKALAKRHLGRAPLDYPGAMRNLPLDVCARYGGADARNTWDLAVKLRAKLAERNQVKVYEDIERPIIPLLTSMERFGHPIDPTRARELRENFWHTEEAIRARFWAEEHLDIALDKDTRELVRRRAGYDPGTCRKDALAKIPGDWMDGILGYRQLRHQRRAFLDKHLARPAAAVDGLIYLHTEFNQAGSGDAHDPRGWKRAPRSGRLSSSGGVNLQNQPGSIRSIFVAPPGCVVWALDYDQLELRIGAALTGDPAMLEDLATGDMHEATRTRLLPVIGRDLPRIAVKQANFSGAYGGHADILRTILQKQRLFIDDDLLEEIADARREVYARYYQVGEEIVQYGRLTGYSETAFGRRRYDSDIRSNDPRAQLHAARAFINHRLGQGTAADLLKIAMRLAVPVLRHYGAHLSIQVHDELVGWVPADVAEPFVLNMRAVLGSVTLLGMTFTVSGGYGETWEAAKGG